LTNLWELVMTDPMDEATTFTCPDCGAVSHNPNDAREGYCGRCHAWTRPDPTTPGNP
jgi:hypothetical protein